MGGVARHPINNDHDLIPTAGYLPWNKFMNYPLIFDVHKCGSCETK